ncbi:MAG: hypothetical protein NZ937_03015 [Armatimonadetes bacterium]|nr:hypothetical protein [Armatimonadota bacterium]
MDPIRDRLNWFEYAANNPNRLIDPSGLNGIIDFIVRIYCQTISRFFPTHHGNFCGPCSKGDPYDPRDVPVDLVDACCKSHDKYVQDLIKKGKATSWDVFQSALGNECSPTQPCDKEFCDCLYSEVGQCKTSECISYYNRVIIVHGFCFALEHHVILLNRGD